MIKTNPDTNIYIFCPSGVVTGGAELLHQLAYTLIKNEKNAYIIYYDGPSAIPQAYAKYEVNVADSVIDKENNVVVLFEAVFDKKILFKKAKVMLWWLSVDNFYYCAKNLSVKDMFGFNKFLSIRSIGAKIYHSAKRRENLFRSTISLKKLAQENYLSCYQSEYAQSFLLKHGFSQVLPLSDYINTDFYEKPIIENRKDIILYNPKKGFAFTKQLIALAPEFEWVPLIGLSVTEMISLFRKSKIYIDFGYHPGKDRIPREAAINGCCIITNKRGSANYFEDVPIFDTYKMDEDHISKQYIISLIQNVFANYSEHFGNFDFYRKRILQEKEIFEKQVNDVFN